MAKVAISHDWLLNSRGAERLLIQVCKLFESPEIYTLFLNRRNIPGPLLRHPIHVSSLNRLPGVDSYYRLLLPFYHRGVRSLHVRDAGLLLSINHCIAKAIPHANGIPHICYCLTPMRYIWEPQLYTPEIKGSIWSMALGLIRRSVKRRDLESNRKVTHFVAISKTIQERIRRVYGTHAEVIYPCADLETFTAGPEEREKFYLVVSALVPQKRVRLAVEAFNRNRKRLVIVGSGPLFGRLRRMAQPNIELLGWQGDEQLRDLYRRARALIFPGIEDFGLVPIEAQACGCPVIAYNQGGLTETIVPEETGWFFSNPTSDSLNRAIEEFERRELNPADAAANARRFSPERFREAWRAFFKRSGFEPTDWMKR